MMISSTFYYSIKIIHDAAHAVAHYDAISIFCSLFQYHRKIIMARPCKLPWNIKAKLMPICIAEA